METPLPPPSSNPEASVPGRPNPHFLADLLLRMPLSSTVTAVLTVCEREPATLFRTWVSLNLPGVSFDTLAETFPEADRAEDCPKLENTLPGGEETCRLLSCGHSFHESCLRRWFRARKACPVCKREVDERSSSSFLGGGGTAPRQQQQQYNYFGELSLDILRDEIRNYLLRHHSEEYGIECFEIPFRVDILRDKKKDAGPFSFAKLLLKLPYQSNLTAIITLFERQPEALNIVRSDLQKEGIPRDVVSTLPGTNRVEDCPRFDPLRLLGDEKGGRKLGCGHSFHDTCLRYWLKVCKNCPVCEREVDWNESMPPLPHELLYVKRNISGITIDEMKWTLSNFLMKEHLDFCKNLVKDPK